MERLATTLIDYISASIDYLHSGGYVMIPLVAISLWMWFIILWKLVELRAYRKEELPTKQCLYMLLQSGGMPRGWQARLIEDFLRRRTFDNETDLRLLDSLIKKQCLVLERNIRIILVLASVAPLLGLLGTVTGMITTFDAISFFGTGNVKALAGGISEALITTQVGLVVAIPGFFMGNFLDRQVKGFEERMREFYLNLNPASVEFAEDARRQGRRRTTVLQVLANTADSVKSALP